MGIAQNSVLGLVLDNRDRRFSLETKIELQENQRSDQIIDPPALADAWACVQSDASYSGNREHMCA